MQVTKPLSKKLQSSSQDLRYAMDNIQDCQAVLQKYRIDDDVFTRLFSRATELNGEDITAPRTTGRQKNRSNTPAENAQQYYKRSVFIPFLDSCMTQLSERFQGGSAIASRFSILLPSYCCNATISKIDIHTLIKLYDAFLPSDVAVETELLRWTSYWQRQPDEKRPDNVMDALCIASELGTYPSLLC